MKENIIKIVREVLENNEKIFKDEITPETHLRNDLGMDSFLLAELTAHIENVYEIDIFEDGMINTISEIYKKLE